MTANPGCPISESYKSFAAQKLLRLAAIAVIGSFVLSLLGRFTTGGLDAIRSLSYTRHEAYMFDAANHFQYEHLEGPEMALARNRITSVMNATSSGLQMILYLADDILRKMLNVIVSAALTVSLFRTAAGTYGGIFAFINSPWAGLTLIAVIAANSMLSVKLSTRSIDRINRAFSELAPVNNLMFAHMRAKGPDIHIFKLNGISMADCEKYLLRPKWVKDYEKALTSRAAGSSLLNMPVKIVVFVFTAVKAWVGAIGIGNFIRPLWFSTNPPPRLTRLRKRKSMRDSMTLPAIRLPCLSATAYPPASSATRSPCSARAIWFRWAATTVWQPTKPANITSYGTFRHSTIPNDKGIHLPKTELLFSVKQV